MKKGLTVLGATLVGGLTTGIVGGMVVNRALKYKPEDLERDLQKRDSESIKKSMKLKDKVITGLVFTTGLGFMALGGAAASSALGNVDIENNDDVDAITNNYDYAEEDCAEEDYTEEDCAEEDYAEVDYVEYDEGSEDNQETYEE